ncbi:mavicyanin-like [Phoenix dactylifera]|uniref:Mavicyanin-like n=1 Tax=Phoenix dactylifera TaxID=42345 RepID=A0A8B7CRD3_PHODC|nr:mavicyanin-like [Phoenix dactylifera]
MDEALAIAILVALASVGLSSGAVYTVGDQAGWTIKDKVNYTAWASSKNFQVGDTILFVYNKDFHNVIEVRMEDYKSCNASPLATYVSGNDSITIKNKGHYFFICGVPGHCTLGQKVDIRVAELAAPSSSPLSAPGNGDTPPPAPTPSPQPSGASAAAASKVVGFLLAGFAFAATFGGLIVPH